MTERYAAFISYSHSDERIAGWLHRKIEGYRFPKGLRGEESAFGPVPVRLPPVFRDRDELPASGDLGSELRAALAASRFQIVLCSPRSARSKWVNEEILAFKRAHGEHRTLALIVEGEPYAGGEDECFPPALRYRLAADGSLSDDPAEPIAADLRKGKDGHRLALLKLLAGISGVRLDQLARRDAARRHRRMAWLTAGSMAITLLTIGLAIYAESQRRVAVEQRELAESSLDFLIGTFEIANPAKENPRTITALTILDRASKRASQEFRLQPRVASRLLRATGDIYFNLGLPREAERDLEKALALEPEAGAGRAQTLLKLAKLAKQRGDPDAAQQRVDAAEKAFGLSTPGADRLAGEVTEQRGHIAYLRGDYAGAARIYARAARQLAALDGDHRAAIAVILASQGQAEIQSRQIEPALRSYARAAELTRAVFGPDHVRFATALHNEALAQFEAGNAERAATIMQRAVQLYSRILEGNHPNLAGAQLLLGRIETSTGQYAAARKSFEKARQIYVNLYGATNAAVGDVDFFTAEAEGRAGHTAEALRLADDVKAIYDLNYGPDDPDQAELLLLRARILSAAARLPEAAARCEQALALQRRLKLGPAQLDETHNMCTQLNKNRRL